MVKMIQTMEWNENFYNEFYSLNLEEIWNISCDSIIQSNFQTPFPSTSKRNWPDLHMATAAQLRIIPVAKFKHTANSNMHFFLSKR